MVQFDSILYMYIYGGHTLLDEDPIALGATSFAHYESRAYTHFISCDQREHMQVTRNCHLKTVIRYASHWMCCVCAPGVSALFVKYELLELWVNTTYVLLFLYQNATQHSKNLIHKPNRYILCQKHFVSNFRMRPTSVSEEVAT